MSIRCWKCGTEMSEDAIFATSVEAISLKRFVNHAENKFRWNQSFVFFAGSSSIV